MKIVREQEWLVQIHLAGRRIRRFAIVPARRRAVGTASRDCLWIRAHYELTHLPDYGQTESNRVTSCLPTMRELSHSGSNRSAEYGVSMSRASLSLVAQIKYDH